MAKSSTSFPNQKNWRNKKEPKVVLRKFLEMLENAKTDDNILCFYDACNSIGWRNTKVDYWAEKLPTFGNLKSEIQKAITSRINKAALEGDFAPAPSIWRMKQQGEKDQQYQDHTTGGDKIQQSPSLTSTQIDKIIDKL